MFSSIKYSMVFWAECELALSWWRMILLSGLIFRSSKQPTVVYFLVHNSKFTIHHH
ncbi:unnamed protein product [Acanthoscelides obtectus]|uniref:Uncharacterized protein n=1 Tax=Acanthoscelides obtectus TaxID=200917 RepID=A0A9P0PS11_ACAOB|nr:unnamed protein product [Acanthoscelides obtectus]CAK1621660.1 hypothetical protein AOBTE_LOCUS1071 [Acanthoscelides obtectus]